MTRINRQMATKSRTTHARLKTLTRVRATPWLNHRHWQKPCCLSEGFAGFSTKTLATRGADRLCAGAIRGPRPQNTGAHRRSLSTDNSMCPAAVGSIDSIAG
jgi:hypothetical protein